MTDAWGSVTQSCIQNCYRAAGWIAKSDVDLEDEHDLPLSVWVQQNNIKQFNNVLNIDDYTTVDDDVLTSGILSSEDIVTEVVKAHEKASECSHSDSEDEILPKKVTCSSAVESLQNLSQFFEAIETDDETFNALSVLRRKLNETKFCKAKQSTLDKYFFTSQ